MKFLFVSFLLEWIFNNPVFLWSITNHIGKWNFRNPKNEIILSLKETHDSNFNKKEIENLSFLDQMMIGWQIKKNLCNTTLLTLPRNRNYSISVSISPTI